MYDMTSNIFPNIFMHHQFVTVVLWPRANSPYPIHLILWGSHCTSVAYERGTSMPKHFGFFRELNIYFLLYKNWILNGEGFWKDVQGYDCFIGICLEHKMYKQEGLVQISQVPQLTWLTKRVWLGANTQIHKKCQIVKYRYTYTNTIYVQRPSAFQSWS